MILKAQVEYTVDWTFTERSLQRSVELGSVPHEYINSNKKYHPIN